MGNKESYGYIDEEEKRKIEELARRPYFKSESYLINARMYLRPDKDEDIE